MVLFERTIKAALIESEGGRHGSIAFESVGFDSIKGIFLDKGRYAGDDIPVPHETV
jgi:hypothetical protein